MINAIQLYGTLILTVLGFVIPILTILITVFPEGVKSLTEKYNNEKKQSDENIATEAQKKIQSKDLDYGVLEKTLKTLKRRKNEAEIKLGYLLPSKFLVRTSTPFLVSFVGVLVALFDVPLECLLITICSSLIAFIAGLLAIITSIYVLFEVAEIVNQKKTGDEQKIIDLLSSLVEKSGDNLFIKMNEIKVSFHNKNITEGVSYDFSKDRKYDIAVSILNDSGSMAKNVEIAFVFPKNIVIEKTSNINLLATETSQIVRFKSASIQSHNRNLHGNLQLTFLKSEVLSIPVFVRGENIKYHKFNLKFHIIT